MAEAAERFRESIRLDPENARAHNNLGSALIALGRPDEAIVEFRGGVEDRHDPRIGKDQPGDSE